MKTNNNEKARHYQDLLSVRSGHIKGDVSNLVLIFKKLIEISYRLGQFIPQYTLSSLLFTSLYKQTDGKDKNKKHTSAPLSISTT